MQPAAAVGAAVVAVEVVEAVAVGLLRRQTARAGLRRPFPRFLHPKPRIQPTPHRMPLLRMRVVLVGLLVDAGQQAVLAVVAVAVAVPPVQPRFPRVRL